MNKILFLFFVVGFCFFVDGVIYSFDQTKFQVGHLMYQSKCMYSPNDPSMSQYSTNPSEVRIEGSFVRADPDYIGILQILVSHGDSFDTIGYINEQNNREYCCRESLNSIVDGCALENVGSLIISTNQTNLPPQVLKIQWNDFNQTPYYVDRTFTIEKSGKHILLFSSCLTLTGDVYMTGTVSWRNPYGYLPTDLYHMIELYEALAAGYFVLSLIWITLCYVYYNNQLLPLHYCVVIVTILGVLESIAWYFDSVNFNEIGTRSIFSTVFAAVLSSSKKSLCRSLLLVVYMGYGLLNSDLSVPQHKKAVGFGVFFFILSFINDILRCYSQVVWDKTLTGEFNMLLSIFDVCFFLWLIKEYYSHTANDQKKFQKFSGLLIPYFVFISVILEYATFFYFCWNQYNNISC